MNNVEEKDLVYEESLDFCKATSGTGCVWKKGNGNDWFSACGNSMTFCCYITPKIKGFRFCPFCGESIVIKDQGE